MNKEIQQETCTVCGNLKRYKHYCETCNRKRLNERYAKKPHMDWDGKTPLTLNDGDDYFFSLEDVIEYCNEYEVKPSELQLTICEPNYLQKVDADYWEDQLGDDGKLNKDVQEALDVFNAVLKKQPPVSWSDGKYRTSISDDILND
jgi:hypothetical protein